MLQQLKDKHRDNWSQQPPWAAVVVARNSAEVSAQHAVDLQALQATLVSTTHHLEQCQKLLSIAARDREEAVARASQLEAENINLQAALCEAKRHSSATNNNQRGASSLSRRSNSRARNTSGNNDDNDDGGDDNDDTNVAGNTAERNRNNDGDDDGNNNNADTAADQQQQPHPEQENVVALLRAQNDALLAQVAHLTADMKNLQSDMVMSNGGSAATSPSLAAFFSARGDDDDDASSDGAASSAALIQNLRRQLALAEERAIISERLAVRAVASSRRDDDEESSRSGSGSNNKPRAAVPNDRQQQEEEEVVGEGGDDGMSPLRRSRGGDDGGAHDQHQQQQQNSTARRQQRLLQQQQRQRDDDVLNAPADGGMETFLDKERQHYFSPSSNMPPVPPSTSEMIRFWTYGQTELAQLRAQLDAAVRRADSAALRAEAADGLARSRGELVRNLHTLAEELEASRDECARLRCDIVGMEREAADLSAHLSAALASQMSAEEVARCARALKDAAAKAATIAALTAPEASVAKDAIKRNQALMHELTMMTKRREELRQEIAAKQSTLDHLSSNIWLVSMNAEELKRAELAAMTSTGKPLALEIAQGNSNKQQQQQQQQQQQPSQQQVLRQKLLDMQSALSERDAVIVDLRRKLAAASAQLQNNSANEQQQLLGEESSLSFLSDALLSTSVRQDSTIAGLKGRLALAQRQIQHHETVNNSTLRALSEVTGLAGQLMSLVDSLLSSHHLFAAEENSNDDGNDDDAAGRRGESANGGNQRNTSSHGGEVVDDDEQQQQIGLVPPPGTLSADELAVVRAVLASLDRQKSFVDGRAALLEAFKGVAVTSRDSQACAALESRAAELSQAKGQISNLLSRLELLQKEAAEHATWNTAVETAVKDMQQQLAEKEKTAVESMSLFADMALHRIDIAAKEQIALVKPVPPSTLGATAPATASAAVDAAKTAVKSADTTLLSSTTADSDAAAGVAPTK